MKLSRQTHEKQFRSRYTREQPSSSYTYPQQKTRYRLSQISGIHLTGLILQQPLTSQMRRSFLGETGGVGLAGCVFCEIVRGATPSHVVYQDEDYIAILDKYPIAFGHTLVMPKKHFERVNDLSIDEFGALYVRVYTLNQIIISRMNASASHISINDGAAANQLIPHVHVHIIPRSLNDSAGFTARKLVKADEMDRLCRKLRVTDL